MRRLRVRAAAALPLLVALVSSAACGDDDNAPVSTRDGGVVDAGQPEIITIDAAPPSGDAGVFSVEDVADTTCGARGGTLREVYPADATKHRPLALVPVGARRAMRTDDGVVFMDADGANATAGVVATPVSINEIASSPNTLFAAGPEGSALKLRRFDANGGALGDAIQIIPTTTGFGAGGGDGKVLVAWVDGYDLRAAGFGEQGDYLGVPFVFRSGVTEVNGATFSITSAGGDEFGVAFAGEYAGTFRLVFTRVSTSARLSTSYTLVLGAEPLRLVQMARVGTGFAILVERRVGNVNEPLVVLVDGSGRFAGPAKRLLGVHRALGIASSGGEIGVVAWRSSVADAGDEASPDAIEFRPFDAAGAPLGSWVCLDEPYAVPSLDFGAAILAEDAGYSVIMRTPKHAVTLARFDRRGGGS